MGPYKGKTPRPFQGPDDDPGRDWLVVAVVVIIVVFVLLAKFQDPILRLSGGEHSTIHP
jgi:hypothetical protein